MRNESLPPSPDVEGLNEDDAAAAQSEYAEQLAAATTAFAAVVNENIEWLDAHLSPSQKAALVEQLSSLPAPYAMPGAAELIAGAVAAFED